MKTHGIFLFFSSIFSISSSKKDPDIQDHFKEKNCDPKCIFNFPNLTKSNMEIFPKSCSQVCAEIYIRNYDIRIDLSEEELILLFQNVKMIIGGLKIIDTSYTSLKFLKRLETVECYGSNDIIIMVNPKMTELGLSSLSKINCTQFVVRHNKRLEALNMPNIKKLTNPNNPNGEVYISISSDSDTFCISPLEMFNFLDIPTTVVNGIFANGFCKNETICTSLSKNCTWILGNITITTDSDLENMRSVEATFGKITISGTNITDFSFLENLKHAANLRGSAILIENNQNLMNLTFPKLKRVNMDSSYALNFENNNPILTLNSSYCFEVRESLALGCASPIFDNWTCEGLEIMHDHIVQKQIKKSGIQNQIGAFFIILIMFLV